jgi:hypothetical protein
MESLPARNEGSSDRDYHGVTRYEFGVSTRQVYRNNVPNQTPQPNNTVPESNPITTQR